MTYYLGKPGALVALPDPEVGLSQTPERIGGTHQLLSGARVRDTIGRMRTWNLSWTAIDLTTFGTLQALYYGEAGPGPYYFMDPEQRNLLTPNVASASSVTNDTTGFTVGANVTVASSAAVNATVYPKRLLLTETTSVVAFETVLIATAAAVNPSTAYTFSALISVAAGTPGHFPSILWQDASGASISSVDGSSYSNTTTTMTLTATSPSNAAFAQCQWKINAAPTSTGFASIEALQLERASSASAWVPGVGVPLVTVDSLSRSTPIAGICDAQMTLVQVG